MSIGFPVVSLWSSVCFDKMKREVDNVSLPMSEEITVIAFDDNIEKQTRNLHNDFFFCIV